MVVVRFEPVPDGRVVLPRGWAPPTPFQVRIYYRDPGRQADVLWLMPYIRYPSGVTGYLAAGPAGRTLDAAEVRHIDRSRVPAGALVQVVTDRDEVGRNVYGQLNHTLN